MKRDYIYAHTQTKDSYKQDKGLTASQWKVYYYLLSISKYDSKSIEDHRFVYKSDFNISEMCKSLNIKSRATYYNAVKKLNNRGLVVDYDKYLLIYAQKWVGIKPKVLTSLLKFSNNEIQSIDLLRTYLIIKKIYELDSAFSVKDIVELLGHSVKDAVQYDRVKAYIALLSFWNLIKVKTHSATASGIGQYTVYHIQWANENCVDDDLYNDLAAEMKNNSLAEEIMDTIKALPWVKKLIDEE